MKKWMNRLITAGLVTVMCLMAFLVISSKLTGHAPKLGEYQLLTVLSGSMEPGIQTGSIILIKDVNDPEAMATDEVITFRSVDHPKTLITHRIMDVVEKDGTIQYVTKGDNNDANDPQPVPSENIVGKYANVTIPYVGYALDFAKSKTGIISLIIIPGLIVMIWQLVVIGRLLSQLTRQAEHKDEIKHISS